MEVIIINIKENAELHWEYTKIFWTLLLKDERLEKKFPGLADRIIECVHKTYVEAMVHGYKHKEDELNGK